MISFVVALQIVFNVNIIWFGTVYLYFKYKKRTSTLPNVLHIEHVRSVCKTVEKMKWF